MAFNTIRVAPGVELSYIDSGAPPNNPHYTTIFAIHGMLWTNLVFQKVQAAAHSKGVRLVAPNRRSWPGSTDFSPEEVEIALKGGSDDQKDEQLKARGHEMATFIDAFIRKFDLPPISDGNETGGVIILGYSIGALFANAAISYSYSLPEDVRERLASHVRGLILHEPGTWPLGLPTAPQNYSPFMNEKIPQADRFNDFALWVSGYFKHGDMSTKDINTLSWITPSFDRVPSIFNIPSHLRDEMTIFDGVGSTTDLPFLYHFAEQLKASYRKALCDPNTLKSFPKMKTVFVTGDTTVAFAIQALWAVQEDIEAQNVQNPISYKTVPGTNHFFVWEDPDRFLDVILSSC